MADDIETTIDEVAAVPAENTADGATVREQPLPDLIAVANRKAAIDAVTGTNDQGGPISPWGFLRPARVITPSPGPT